MKDKKENTERKLTPAEEKRKIVFEKVCKEMEREGYKQKDLTVSSVQANVYSILLTLPFIIVSGIIFFLINKGVDVTVPTWTMLILFACFIGLTVIHELIHGVTWGAFAKNHFKSIKFGVVWESLNPYCTCADPLNKGQYILGALMPTLILGFELAIVATILGNFFIWVLAAFMILGGGGDFFVVMKILQYKTDCKDVLYLDHPYAIGLVAFEK